MTETAFSSIPRCPAFPRRRISFTFSGPTANIRSWKPGFWIIVLILHMEHGGGNNSTFTTHVVTSSGTDTYSSMAASLGSLKGPKHGGANIKVVPHV